MRRWSKRVVLLVAAAGLLAGPGSVVQSAVPPQPKWPGQIPDTVKLIADVPYAGTDNPVQTLDLVLPVKRAEDPLPVVVYVHGGAWLAVDKSFGLPPVIPYAASGQYAGVTIGYRLSGEATWPAQIHDCKAAIRWIRANAAKYGLDADRIGVWGDSAGGHLVAILGTSGDVPAMNGRLGPNADLSSRVACVVDFFGPTDLLRMVQVAPPESDQDAANWPETRLIGGPIQDNPEKVASASPLTYVTADDPPFLIVHGTQDPIVPFNQSELLHAALAKAGVPSTLIAVEGAGHGTGFPPEAGKLARRFFDDHLRGQKSEWKDQTIPAALQKPQGQ
jgi:acetyl esterase/lipase